MSKILVTGGAGFIGTHLVDALVAAGDDVCVLDDFSASDKLSTRKHGVRVFDGSVTDKKLVRSILSEGIQRIYHLATRNITVSAQDPKKAFAVNSGGTMIVLREAAHAGCEHVVYTSTTSVYDNSAVMPMTETTDVKPRTTYSVAKYAGELCRYSVPECRFTVLRLSNVYGPGQIDTANPYCGVIGHFMRAARDEKPIIIFGDGSDTRDYTFIYDVVKALMSAMGSKRKESESVIFNVSTGIETSTRHLAEMVQRVSGQSLAIEYRDKRSIDVIRRRVVDSTLFRNEFNQHSSTNLYDGLSATWEWWNKCR